MLSGLLVFGLVGAALWWTLDYGIRNSEYSWSWDAALETVYHPDGDGRPPLIMGLWLTLRISLVAILVALPLGIVVGLGRVSPNWGYRGWAAIYVEAVRNTPLLVQIMVAYFIIGTVFDKPLAEPLGKHWEDHRAFLLGGMALSVFAGAYLAEIIRGGIEAVDRGQMEAARALGLSRGQAMRHVILPQALRHSLPAMAGQFISTVKDSSLLSVIGVVELVKSARDMIGWHFLSLETWVLVAILYFVICFPLSVLVRLMERRFARAD